MINGAQAQLGLIFAVIIPDILPRLESVLAG